MKALLGNTKKRGHLGYLAVLSCIATLIAVITGIFITMLGLGGMSLIAFLIPTMLVSAACLAAAFAAPVTFILLPLGAFLMRNRPTIASFALPLVGAIGGGLTMSIWQNVAAPTPPSAASIELLVSGMMAGLAAGAFYGRAIREIYT